MVVRMIRGGQHSRVAAGTVTVLVLAVGAVGCSDSSTGNTKNPSTNAIKVAVLSDCQGAFGTFDNQNLAGVVAAMSKFAGGRPVDPANPRKGWTGASVGGRPLLFSGVGCGDDRADTAIKETRRLMEQGGADLLIGPLSGDESIAVANYAKQHPKKTFVDGAAGAQDTTLKVNAPNFFRFNGDGAQWNAGLGELAYSKLGWRTAAIVADDYSFAWTSAAGFISEFCGVGGTIAKRVFAPLNTTDYSSYADQLPKDVDGYFIAVGGSGLVPFLKAYEQSKGPINGQKFIGNLFWATPGQFEALGTRVAGAYAGGAGTAGDLTTPAATEYADYLGKIFTKIPPFGDPKPQAASAFTYSYYVNTMGLIKGLQAVSGDLGDGHNKLRAALAKVEVDAPYGKITLDANRQAVIDVYPSQLYLKDGKIAVKSVAKISGVDQSFGGTFSASTSAPSRDFPPCVKRTLPWVGHTQAVGTGG